MAIELRVPNDLAVQAIQEHVADLKQQKKLGFSGKLTKTCASSECKFKEASSIHIQSFKEHCPLNRPFEFEGWARLTYTFEHGNGERTDGCDYVIRGEVTLSDDDGYICVSLKNNEIIITDNQH